MAQRAAQERMAVMQHQEELMRQERQMREQEYQRTQEAQRQIREAELKVQHEQEQAYIAQLKRLQQLQEQKSDRGRE